MTQYLVAGCPTLDVLFFHDTTPMWVPHPCPLLARVGVRNLRNLAQRMRGQPAGPEFESLPSWIC